MKDVKKVIACLRAAGFKPAIGNFEDKLKIQKMVCLLQLKGLDMGFSYGLYVRGPYSPELTREMYGRREEFEGLHSDVKLTNKETKSVEELRERFEMKASLLELAATYGYYVMKERQDPITAIKNTKRLKPFYSEAQVAIGISRANAFLFKPGEKEELGMRREHEAWERASLNDLKE